MIVASDSFVLIASIRNPQYKIRFPYKIPDKK